jgi:outer membrane protein assembly factor BamA
MRFSTKKNIPFFLLILLALTACTPSQETKEETIYISDIAFHTQDEVAAVLGESISSETTDNGIKHLYKDGRFEVVYINEKADWITINDYWEDIDLSEIKSYVLVNTFEDHVIIKASTK